MIAVGPLAGSAWGVLRQLDPASRPALWAVSELPIEANPPPSELTDALRRTRRLAVVEEHVAPGGVGQAMCRWVIEAEIGLDRFQHLHATPRPGSTYGSQVFLRRRSGLDPEGIALAAKTLAS
jgi:transketolase